MLNDTDNAVANALAAVNAGARQIQGTINGLGERGGIANLISLIPSLVLKTNYKTNISKDKLKNLIHVSRSLNDILNMTSRKNAPYVGDHAFSHKGGLHASAIEKNSSTYEHIDPEIVGNSRNVIISNQAGRSNILSQLNKINIDLPKDEINSILDIIKEKESEGYSFDTALASFELLVRRHLGHFKDFYNLENLESRMKEDGMLKVKLLQKQKLQYFLKSMSQI